MNDLDTLADELAAQVEDHPLVKDAKRMVVEQLARERASQVNREQAASEFEERGRTLRRVLDQGGTAEQLAAAFEAARDAEKARRS